MNKSTQTALDLTRQQLLQSTRELALVREKQRKQETRFKIELGGLIIKAGLQQEDKSTLLGLLLAAKQQLLAHENWRLYWQQKGRQAFKEECSRVKQSVA